MIATLKEFLNEGVLGPITLGIDPDNVFTILGDPEDISKKMNPLLLKYGSLQLTFWKNVKQRKQELREIAFVYQPKFKPLPDTLSLLDWSPQKAPTVSEFRNFLVQIHCEPLHEIDGDREKQLIFFSGVKVIVIGNTLDSIRLTKSDLKRSTPLGIFDEREPTKSQILDILMEASNAMNNKLYHASLLVAWAAVEATLRRVARDAGLTPKVGWQPVMLLKELLANSILRHDQYLLLERMRQLRTASAHGLSPMPVDLPDLQNTISFTKDVLENTADERG